MNFDKYKSTLQWKTLSDFSKYIYRSRLTGQLVEFDFKADALELDHKFIAKEDNKEAFEAHRKLYNAERSELAKRFLDDLLKYFDIPDNELSQHLIQMAKGDCNPLDCQNFFDEFEELSKIYFIAEKTFNK